MNKMISKSILLLLLLWISTYMQAQTYPDHFGAGNDVGLTVTSSPEQGTNASNHTLNGTGLLPDLEGASRFLGQATLGANYEDRYL